MIRTGVQSTQVGKIQRVKTQRAKKTSEDFAEEKMFAEDIQKISQISLLLDFIVFLEIFEIFAEDCFLLRSFRKFLPSGFLPLSRFQAGSIREFSRDDIKTCRIGANSDKLSLVNCFFVNS